MKYQTKAILTGFIGNLVEAYDVAICFYLSSVLSQKLVGNNEGDPRIVLMLLCLAYLAKPIGAFVLGLCSDRFGRKKIMTLSIFLTGLSTALVGLVPEYARIGIYSAILLLGLRLIQSMALGSEFLNSSSFLVESGAEQQRGFRGCWSSVGVKAGTLLACLSAELAYQFADYDWAWRVPFLMAALTMSVGVYIRYRMPESLSYVLYYANRVKPTTGQIYRQSIRFIRQYPFLFLYAFITSFLSVASSFFFYLYMPLHAVHHAHLSKSLVTGSTLFSLTLTCLFIPCFGRYSDQIDRLRLLTASTIGLLVLSYPFMQAVNAIDPMRFVIMQGLVSIACAGYYSVGSVILTELFPLPIRCTALSITFSFAACIAAGVPTLIADYLARHTASPNSPALIIISLSVITLLHIKHLARHYRTGKNQYRGIALLKSEPVFHIHYTEHTATTPNGA